MRVPIRVLDDGPQEQLPLLLPPRVEVQPKRAEPVQLELCFTRPLFIGFNTIQSERFQNDGVVLEPYNVDISRILIDNSVRDIQESEDRHFLRMVESSLADASSQFIGRPATPEAVQALGDAASSIIRDALNRESFARRILPTTRAVPRSEEAARGYAVPPGLVPALNDLFNPPQVTVTTSVSDPSVVMLTSTFTVAQPITYTTTTFELAPQTPLGGMTVAEFLASEDDGDIQDDEIEIDQVPVSMMQRARPRWTSED